MTESDSNAAQSDGKAVSDRKYLPCGVSALFLLLVLLLVDLFVGKNDLFSVFLLFAALLVFTHTVLSFRLTIKRFLSRLFSTNSFVYKHLSGEGKKLFDIALSTLIGSSLAFGFLIVAKTLFLVHGFFWICLALFLVGLMSQMFSPNSARGNSKDVVSGSIASENDAEKIARLILTLKFIFTINIFLAIIVSAHTIFNLGGAIDFNNYLSFAEQSALDVDSGNKFFGAIINIGLVLDSFKNAAASTLIDKFGVGEGSNSFFILWFSLLFLNFFYVLPVTIAFVFFYHKIYDYLGKGLACSWEKGSVYTGRKVKSIVEIAKAILKKRVEK